MSKIENDDQRERYLNNAIDALEYDEYFAHNRHFKCESYLIGLRRYYLRGYEDENMDDFIDRILHYTGMEGVPCSYKQNILIVNDNKKFTFLNTSKLNDSDKILEKGKTKLRREYLRTWEEGNDDDEEKFRVVFIRLRGHRENKGMDDEEFKRTCDRIKAEFF